TPMRIILTGPTASGKTDLSLRLAELLNCPIISADSRQCYRYMNIGTGKVTSKDMGEIPHYNISIFGPDEKDDAAAFAERCKHWEAEIAKTSPHVIYAGGSTLYLEALLRPLDDLPKASTENLLELERLERMEGQEYMLNQLRKADPEYADRMEGYNRQRLFRALDVWMQTGKPFSSFHKSRQKNILPGTLVFGIPHPREILYDRINKRVDNMITSGLIDEVRGILDMGYKAEDHALQTVGYREVISYFNEKLTREEMIEKIKTNTRRYAKRQLTWFRRWDFLQWLKEDDQLTMINNQLSRQ
ncbi:MAG: tRNA (adenosine(37)-N6)-dimethylallyltransferase MiaA, partial [Balneolales bacterium]